MIDALTSSDAGTADTETLRALRAHADLVVRSAGRGRATVVAQTEDQVRVNPAGAFSFDATGLATLSVGSNRWSAGRFGTASLEELRQRAVARAAGSGGTGRLRLWVVDGGAPPTDIGSLQAQADAGTLFQVASQFNCLEAPGPSLTSVASYLGDSTQGPRAAISALPGTLLRHYAAPDGRGGRFVQQDDGAQLELLGDVCDPGVARVRNGYLMAREIRDAHGLVAALEARFASIRVGVHEDVEVVLGYAWEGAVATSPAPVIAQVFTSTLAGGGYGSVAGPLRDVCRHLLRAAYLGTLLTAVALGHSRVVLTLIGGGAFGNPQPSIWGAIGWAMDEVAPLVRGELTVVVNGRRLDEQIGRDALLAILRPRGGALLAWPRDAPPSIVR